MLGDGIADAGYEGDKERQVHCAGYARSVLQIEGCKVIDE